MTCPYSEAKCAGKQPDAGARRCQCGRFAKRCADCTALNRAFANFCRACGNPLPPGTSNWSGFRGGARRLGANDAAPRHAVAGAGRTTLQLGSECRALLGYDGQLIAVSQQGVVEVFDPVREKTLCRFQSGGVVTTHPCIHNGVLYLGTRDTVTAYSLAAMTLEPPRVRSLWQLAVDGTPIHALTPVGDRLYVTAASAGRHEVLVIDNVASANRAVRSVHRARQVSWLAADPDAAAAVFFSQSGDGAVQLHVAGQELKTHSVSASKFIDQPVAVLGSSVFAIFGDERRLHRIRSTTGQIEQTLEDDTQLFAMIADASGEWDGDSIRIDNDGVVFSSAGVRDSFAPDDRAIKSSPVVVRDCTVAIGMEDGRVRMYDLAQLPRHELWQLNGGSAITALVSFDSYIAAGNKDGVVELREFRAAGAAR